MRTTIYLKHLLSIIAFFYLISGHSQTTNADNQGVFNTDYLGWDASVTDNLLIRHNNPSQHIAFRTNGLERMRIHSTGNVSIGTSAQYGCLNILQQYGEYGIEADHSVINIITPFYTGLDLRILAPGLVYNYGIITEGSNNSESLSIGLNTEAFGASTNYAIYSSTPSSQGWAGFFNGDVYITGSYPSLSDENIKENFETIQNGREILLQLKPMKYEFIEHPYLNLPNEIQFGLSAQELQEILPALVDTVIVSDYDPISEMEMASVAQYEFLSINYTELIPFLIAGVKELNQLLDENEIRLQNLQYSLDEANTLLNLYNELNNGNNE